MILAGHLPAAITAAAQALQSGALLGLPTETVYGLAADASSDSAHTPPWDAVLALPGAHLHLYGKQDAKRGRKMGHLNITAATPEAARATALQAAALLGLPAF